MPYYEYHCATNGRTVEVRHGMSERLERWSDLAQRAGVEPGDTPGDAPVTRLISVPVPLGAAGGEPQLQSCGAGCACAKPS
jgi:hypothetical protein